ncbi:MAG TPA: ribonuclease D [Thiolapillus brandeum]|uniref:Ribonuclease D n=1 Tax=Thiolapillus brandeum TaxID=1076588 RepID=A0A7C5IYI5_9GAMM|nr:ribonuclease D [Thiolapillus brandeum]
MQESFIDRPDQLASFVDLLRTASWLAVDTEFMRERTYFPRLCLIQVAGEDRAACIDPLALEDLSPLKELLLDPAITKVFHAARQDLEIFLHLWGELPTPIFDTQPAAALLGIGDQVGYGALVQEMLGVSLAKDHSRTDWSQRPLQRAQLRYALDDVVHLGRAYTRMHARLEALGRLEWLETEFESLTDPATYALEPMEMWKRVKGRQHLKGVRLAVLQQLAAWREEEALARNLPRRWVLKDELLLELARRCPQNRQELSRVRGVDASLVHSSGEALLERIRLARELPKEAWPREKPRPPKASVAEEATLDILGGALRLIAEASGLSPQLIASRKDLAALLREDPDARLMQGWRRRLAGEPLRALLRGERRIALNDGIATLEP